MCNLFLRSEEYTIINKYNPITRPYLYYIQLSTTSLECAYVYLVSLQLIHCHPPHH